MRGPSAGLKSDGAPQTASATRGRVSVAPSRTPGRLHDRERDRAPASLPCILGAARFPLTENGVNSGAECWPQPPSLPSVDGTRAFDRRPSHGIGRRRDVWSTDQRRACDADDRHRCSGRDVRAPPASIDHRSERRVRIRRPRTRAVHPQRRERTASRRIQTCSEMGHPNV